MKLETAVKRLKAFQNKEDIDGGLTFLAERDDDFPALHAVILADWADLVPRLDYLEISDTLDWEDDDGRKALHLAANASPETLRAVLLQGVDSGMFEFDGEEYTPAMTAAAFGNLDNLRLLVQAGADLDQVGPEMGRTALESACHLPNSTVVRYLLDAGADASLVNMDDIEATPFGEEAVKLLEDAAALRNAMPIQRVKALQYDTGAGEGDLVIPAQLRRMSNLFIADVIGDLSADCDNAHLDHGEQAFGDGPGAVLAASMLGLSDVADRIARKREIKAAESAPAPKASKPH